MTAAIVTTSNANTGAIAEYNQAVAAAGAVANDYAAAAAFADYTSRKSNNTVRSQHADLATWANFYSAMGIVATADQLQTTPQSWHGVTWGMVAAFTKWMLSEGYAISTINRKLSTVKVYAALAAKSGVISADDMQMIKAVTGYSHAESKRINERRTRSRVSTKKQAHTAISASQAAELRKRQNDTPQAARDSLIMALLLDHGLRVGEVAGLKRHDFDWEAGTFSFYRPKVDATQTHRMTAATRAAFVAYVIAGAPTSGQLLRSSRKNGELGKPGMSERAITARVGVLGRSLGIDGLSAHDCRHYWASQAARSGTDAFALRDAGGWSSLAMPSRYVEAAAIANSGVKLE